MPSPAAYLGGSYRLVAGLSFLERLSNIFERIYDIEAGFPLQIDAHIYFTSTPASPSFYVIQRPSAELLLYVAGLGTLTLLTRPPQTPVSLSLFHVYVTRLFCGRCNGQRNPKRIQYARRLGRCAQCGRPYSADRPPRTSEILIPPTTLWPINRALFSFTRHRWVREALSYTKCELQLRSLRLRGKAGGW